jgi:hypothetical protein
VTESDLGTAGENLAESVTRWGFSRVSTALPSQMEGTSNHCGCRVHKMTETAGADEAMDQDGTKSEQLAG